MVSLLFHHDLQHLISYVLSDVIQCVCLGAKSSEFQTDYVLHATEALLIVAEAQILQIVLCFNCRTALRCRLVNAVTAFRLGAD
jgi:hypothetical protein